MSEDLTKKLPSSDTEKIDLILAIVKRSEKDYDDVAKRLNSLEQKVEERLYDTRPMWQKVIADIAKLQEGQTRLEYKLDVLNETMLTVQAKHKGLDVRVRELEQRPQKPSNSQT